MERQILGCTESWRPNYSPHRSPRLLIRSPQYLAQLGGICKNIIFRKKIFDIGPSEVPTCRNFCLTGPKFWNFGAKLLQKNSEIVSYISNKCCKTTFFVVSNFFNIYFVDPKKFLGRRNFCVSGCLFEILKRILEKVDFLPKFPQTLEDLKIPTRGGWGSTLWDVADISKVY